MLTVYSTKTCTWCKSVEKYLSMKGINYTVEYIDDNENKRRELFDRTGMTSVPVTTDGSQYVVGYNISKLSQLM